MITLRIALRYLFAKKSHNAVNVISLISVAGVAVATAAIVCVLSVFNGFSDLAYSQLSMIDPELKLLPKQGKTIESADVIAKKIEGINGVRMALPTLNEQALAIYGERQLPVTLQGVTPDYNNLVTIDSIMIDGHFTLYDSLTSSSCAVLSVGSAISLGARPGYEAPLMLFVPKRTGRISQANPMASFRSDSLWVAGVYEVTQGNHDASTVMIPINNLRRMLDYTTEASSIDIALIPGTDTERVARDIKDVTGDSYIVADRMMQQENSFRMIKIEKWITFLMLAFILIIASFNVISTLSMLIIEKHDNMDTLRALGATSQQISRIFLWEGWLISLIGGISGILLGVICVLAQQWFGIIKLSADPAQLAVIEYPVRLQLLDLLCVTALVALVGYIIGLAASRFSRR